MDNNIYHPIIIFSTATPPFHMNKQKSKSIIRLSCFNIWFLYPLEAFDWLPHMYHSCTWKHTLPGLAVHHQGIKPVLAAALIKPLPLEAWLNASSAFQTYSLIHEPYKNLFVNDYNEFHWLMEVIGAPILYLSSELVKLSLSHWCRYSGAWLWSKPLRSSGRWSSKVQSSLVYKAHSREVSHGCTEKFCLKKEKEKKNTNK